MLSQADTVRCISCGNDTFQDFMKVKKLSKIRTGASEDKLLPYQVMKCSKCGEVLEELLAPALREDKPKIQIR